MRKKFLYLVLLSLAAVLLSVVLVTFPEKCIPQGPPEALGVMCSYQAGSRGFPYPVFYLSYHNDLGWLELVKTPMQVFGFVVDLIFYFLIFSAIYFAYSKVFKKAKKK